MTLPTPPPALRALALVLLTALGAAPTRAQLALPCEVLLEEAQARYEALDFEGAAVAAQACVARAGLERDLAVRAYRMIALASLRLEAVADAEAALASLFAVAPDYAPDPVTDPPLYVAFVEGYRARLGLPPPAPEPAPEAEPPPASALIPRRAYPALHLGAHLAAASYGGERGVKADTALREFVENVGFAAGASLEAWWSPVFGTALRARLLHLSARFHHEVAPEGVLRRADSSPWTLALAVEALGRLPLGAPLEPGLGLGLGPAVSRLNDTWQVGVALEPSVFAEVPLTPGLRGVLRAEAAFVFPGEALDLRAVSGVGAEARDRSFDLVTTLSAGVRARLGG